MYRFLDSIGCSTTRILAKIETRQALLNLNGILQQADGIIMSRGSLGLDCPPEKMAMVQKTLVQVRSVCVCACACVCMCVLVNVCCTHMHTHMDCPPEKMGMVQKMLVQMRSVVVAYIEHARTHIHTHTHIHTYTHANTQSCNLTGKPVLITRVVDTMQNSPRPTRAEATDVANAVLDGVDGILLGAETLRGVCLRASVVHVCVCVPLCVVFVYVCTRTCVCVCVFA